MKALLIIIAILMLATPAMANTSTHVEASHSLEVHLDGEWNFNSGVAMPSVQNDISLDGVGEAYIKSDLYIIERVTVSSNWWDLF